MFSKSAAFNHTPPPSRLLASKCNLDDDEDDDDDDNDDHDTDESDYESDDDNDYNRSPASRGFAHHKGSTHDELEGVFLSD